MRTLGTTGTREGAKPAQKAEALRWMRALRDRGLTTTRSGDCYGWDAEFHVLALEMGFETIGHPPTDPEARAFCAYIREEVPLPYLARNEKIVRGSDLMLAVPKESSEPAQKRGGGTWATIRCAKRLGKPLVIIFPEGNLETHNWKKK